MAQDVVIMSTRYGTYHAIYWSRCLYCFDVSMFVSSSITEKKPFEPFEPFGDLNQGHQQAWTGNHLFHSV